MRKWHLIQNQLQLREIFTEPPLISYRKKENPWKTFWLEQSYKGIKKSISELQESRRPVNTFCTNLLLKSAEYSLFSLLRVFYWNIPYSVHFSGKYSIFLRFSTTIFNIQYSPSTLVLFRDSLLPRPENGPEPRREKRESCITCRRMLGTSQSYCIRYQGALNAK